MEHLGSPRRHVLTQPCHPSTYRSRTEVTIEEISRRGTRCTGPARSPSDLKDQPASAFANPSSARFSAISKLLVTFPQDASQQGRGPAQSSTGSCPRPTSRGNETLSKSQSRSRHVSRHRPPCIPEERADLERHDNLVYDAVARCFVLCLEEGEGKPAGDFHGTVGDGLLADFEETG